MIIVQLPIIYLNDPLKGRPLFSGQIFIGEVDLDPEIPANQKQLNVIEPDGTVVPVSQPFIVSAGGNPVYNGDPVRLDVDGNYSIKILNKLGAQVYYIENVEEAGSGGGAGSPSDLTQPWYFDTVALMTASVLELPVGKIIITKGYYSTSDGGGTKYIIKDAAQVSTDGDSVDGLTNHTLASADFAIIQHDGIVDFRMSGGKPYDVATKLDNVAILLAADAQGFTIEIVGQYFFLTAVDLGLAQTNLRSQIIGVENTNFDSFDKSAFYFEDTGGLTVYAGAKIHDIEIKNLGGKNGVGFIADNVHAGSIKNVTVTNFAKGAELFVWASSVENLITFQCTKGIETIGECTSTTFKSCYAREGEEGIIIGENITYCTFLNCAVDACDSPYVIKGGSNVDLNNCGAEIGHANIDGFFEFTGDAASTVSISGGRYIMLGGFTNDSIAYTTIGAVNTFGNIIFSRFNTNSFTNPVSGFVVGKVRAVLADSCVFSDTFNLEVKEGEFGSIMMDGRSSGTLRRFAKKTPKVGSSQNDAESIPNMLAITIEEVIDFQQAIDDSEVVFVKFFGVEATSRLQLKVEAFPLTNTGTGAPYVYQEFAGWGFGTSNAFGSNIDGGTLFDFKLNDANGYQNFYIKRSAIQGKAFVRVTATGWSDSGFRDVLCTLTVGPDDA